MKEKDKKNRGIRNFLLQFVNKTKRGNRAEATKIRKKEGWGEE